MRGVLHLNCPAFPTGRRLTQGTHSPVSAVSHRLLAVCRPARGRLPLASWRGRTCVNSSILGPTAAIRSSRVRSIGARIRSVVSSIPIQRPQAEAVDALDSRRAVTRRLTQPRDRIITSCCHCCENQQQTPHVRLPDTVHGSKRSTSPVLMELLSRSHSMPRHLGALLAEPTTRSCACGPPPFPHRRDRNARPAPQPAAATTPEKRRCMCRLKPLAHRSHPANVQLPAAQRHSNKECWRTQQAACPIVVSGT